MSTCHPRRRLQGQLVGHPTSMFPLWESLTLTALRRTRPACRICGESTPHMHMPT